MTAGYDWGVKRNYHDSPVLIEKRIDLRHHARHDHGLRQK
jgi:hypothetical protein